MSSIIRINGLVLALAALCLLASGPLAWAQDGGGQGDQMQTRDQTGDLERDRVQDATQSFSQDREQLRERLHSRIDASAGLTAEERAAMHANADACVELGISPSGLDALFPGEATQTRLSAQTMLRLQERVMKTTRDGLPVDPVTAKIQEGRTKGVPGERLEQACERMESHVRTAHRIMNRAVDDGLDPPGEPAKNRRMNGEMAWQMWRGMNEEGYDHLCERARERLRDGRCGVDDLVSAGELATRLMESGVERRRATRFAGEALQQGYTVQEIRQLQLMVAARHHRGDSMDGFMGDMEHCVGAGMQTGEMYNYMMRHGWMGPGDMYGPGGYQPSEHKGYGGHQGEGGDGGHGGHHGDGGGSGQGG